MRGAGRTAGLPIDRVFDVRATSKPAPLVPRAAIAEVHERVSADGAVIAPLDETTRARDAAGAARGRWSSRASRSRCCGRSATTSTSGALGGVRSELAPGAFVSLSSADRAAPG